MPDTDSNIENFMATLRVSIGDDALENATPEQTLRPRSSAILNESDVSTMVAPPSVASSSTKSEAGKDSLARWSEFTIHNMVGKGGMGQIFRAGQKALRREVAIKQIIPEHLKNASAKKSEDA